MQRICTLVLLAAILAFGCGDRGDPRPAADGGPGKLPLDVRQAALQDGKPRDDAPPPLPAGDSLTPSLPPMSDKEAYDFSFQKAIGHVARREYAEALAALKEAQKKEDTGAVQREMDRVAALVAQQEAGEKAASDVKAVLDDGKPEVAAKLAQDALSQFGGGDQGAPLTRLQTQAEAEVTAEAGNPAVRRATLKASAEAALAEGNLRAALVAMEQAQAIAADEAMAAQLDGLRAKLADYDDNRRRALEARRDAARMEESLTRLKAAKAVWDTLQIRQEIDEAVLVLERRRDRLSVADFEVRGDVGLPAAGKAVAEELLGRFKGRYDLVERGQLAKLADELKLESGDLLEGGAGRRELGRLARVRYLVVGSVTPLAGITVQARLVEAGTGLIVQTARVSAPTPEALMPRLKDLAVMLQMDDAAKAAYEEKLIGATEALKPLAATAVEDIPPPPPPPPAVALALGEPAPPPPPPPILTFTPRPPDLGGVVIADFAPARLPPLLVADAPPPPPPVAFGLVIARDRPRRNRMLRLSLELGDNLFRRGRFREAQRHFGLALTLAGPRREISLRLDACRDAAPPPPPPVVVVAPAPVLVAPSPFVVVAPPPPPVVFVAPPRPRMAVFAFVPSNPRLVPERGGEILADQMAGYFGGQYEVVDRGEVSWYMGRLGITMKDVLGDPIARRALSESLNTRFFLFTTLRETASMDAEAHLIDARSDVRTASASIHVQDDKELKLRLGEIAGQLGAKPAARKEMARAGAASEKALNEARALVAKEPAKAAAIATAALKAAPDSVALRTLQAEALRRQRIAAYEASRRKDQAARALAAEAAKKRQQELAIETAQARLKAEAAAKTRSAAQVAEARARRDKAAVALQARAKAASAKGDSRLAVSLLQSASTLRPSESAFQELAKAKVQAAADSQKAAQALDAKRLAAGQKQREAAAARVGKERKSRQAAQAEQKKSHDAHVARLRDGYVKQGRAALKAGKPAEALAAAQAAQKAQASPEAAKLLSESQHALSLASAKGAAEKRKLEQEQAARVARDAATAKKRSLYASSLDAGAADAKAGRYGEAVAKYEAASKLFPGDPVAANGLKAARELKSRQEAAARASAGAAQKRKDHLTQLSAQARAAEGKRDFRKAADLWREAARLAPGDLALQAAMHKAEGGRDAEASRARREMEEKGRKAAVARLVAAGKKARTPREAIDAYRRALAQDPANAEARSLLAKAEASLPRPVDPQSKKRQDDHRLAVAAGDAALKANDPKGAANAYREALRLVPGDPAAKAKLANAEKLFRASLEREDRARMDAAYAKEFAAGSALSRQGKFAQAVAAFDRALAAKPGDKQALLGQRLAQDGLKPKPADPAKAAYDKAMSQAGALMAKKDYRDAQAWYGEALKHRPADKAALEGKARAAALLVPKPDPKKTLYDRAMSAAGALMAKKDYAGAIRSYDAALKNLPGDRAAMDGKARATALMTPPADPAKAAYDKAMSQAGALMAKKDYRDAQAWYGEALKHRPGDKAALEGKARAAALLAPKPDPKRTLYDRAMSAAGALMAKKDYAGAIRSYDAALKNVPGDRAASDGKARATALMTPKPDSRKAAYDKAMSQGRAAAARKEWMAASAAYAEALKQHPADPAATRGQAQADAAYREQAYQAWLNRGQALLAAKKHAEAAAAFDNALKARPGDKAAIAGKQAALAAAKPAPPPKPPAAGIAVYNAQFAAARDLEKKAKWADASAHYAAALSAVAADPKHAREQAAAYAGIGRSEQAQKQFAKAIKAYDEALKRDPKDAASAAALARARKGM